MNGFFTCAGEGATLVSRRPVRAVLRGSLLLLVCLASASTALATMPAKETLRHGSRAKAADGTMVVYDKVNGVFIVPGHKDTYWVDDKFYEYRNGVWVTSAQIAGPWELIPQHLVPDPAIERYEPLKTPVTATLPSGREVVFEPRLKVFKVAGRKGVFLFDGRFYRYDDGVWLESKSDDGPWTTTSMKILPVVLRKAVPEPEEGATVALPTGEKVVYDAGTKIFHVENKPDTLLFDGTFYERRDDKWFSAPGAAAGFKELGVTKLPPAVRLAYRKTSDGGKKPPKNAEDKKKDRESKAGDAKAGHKKGAKNREKAAKHAAGDSGDDSAGDRKASKASGDTDSAASDDEE
ncbi:MAG TPA: hypothetical protein VN634_15825 [Candidatus Limnocylindrales bacterium]|nr:hypothetical protein [Candidatus Limnocylindrales bacterium]